MSAIIYGIIAFISLICTGIYFYIWVKHFDVNFTVIFILVPIAAIGYYLQETSTTQDGIIKGIQVCYIGGSYLELFIVLCIFNLCGIEIKRWLRTALFCVCTMVFVSTLTIGYTDIFYKSMQFKMVGNYGVLTREYGFMHTVFYVVVAVLFLSGIIAILYSYLKKKQVPRIVLLLLLIPDVICMLGYFVGRRLLGGIDPVPLGYVIAQIMFLLLAYRMSLYNVSDTVIESMIHETQLGYISFDFNYRYLGSDEIGKRIVPEIADLAVDEVFGYKPSERRIRHFLDDFKNDPTKNLFTYIVADPDGDHDKNRIFNATVNYLHDGRKRRGYIVTFMDDTANRKYIQLLDTYNENLQQEVEQKTQSILEMHDNLIMSLAIMVESRDNSTGGHIKRTSEGVRILIDEIKKEGKLSLSQEFCKDVIKAAPMHDLGKIAVDDAVLRKPGKFTDAEYEEMKKHAAEGGRIISEILKQTEDESFKEVARNVAHYHHERWDGSGYPQGLAGEQIPIEARIMAIADVYDALVSKRVYKDAFSFEKANAIIMEGMGTQFDPSLKQVYEAARPRLEEYYQNQ
ncbi:MAG: HD domain-containing protein [Lachnospiraceae bacterium]|nr:HD domain-containing protein [Lachnospiraceae bacterium]